MGCEGCLQSETEVRLRNTLVVSGRPSDRPRRKVTCRAWQYQVQIVGNWNLCNLRVYKILLMVHFAIIQELT